MQIDFIGITGDLTSENITDTNIMGQGIAILNELKYPIYYHFITQQFANYSIA